MEKEKKQIIGYDFDGVIATEINNWFSNLLWKLFPKQWAPIVHSLARHTGIIPEKGSYIITGRMVTESGLTLRQMKKWGIDEVWLIMDKDKYFPDRKSSIEFKKRVIEKFGITLYYENDDEVIKELKKRFEDKLTIIKYQ